MKANINNLAYIGTKPGVVDENRDSDSWFTPESYTEMVREVLGHIDLDPFSSEVGNKYVQASRYISIEDDAFQQVWFEDQGRVFMNPPYGRKLINAAVDLFVENWEGGKITEAIVLVNNATETKWFQALIKHSKAICLPDRRIAFENNDGKNISGNTRGQVFLYFGNDDVSFRKVFGRIGISLVQ